MYTGSSSDKRSSADESSHEVGGSSSSSSSSSSASRDHPPADLSEVLDPGSYRRLNDVRKQIWTSGLQGLAFGTLLGFGGHRLYAVAAKSQKGKLPPLPKHSLIPTVMISGALVSFAFSAVAGRVGLQGVGDIFQENAKPTSTYMKQQLQNQREIRRESEDAFLRRQAAIQEALEKKQQQERFGGAPPEAGRSF